ncbi:CLUMA_CG018548, isoform A [Clunio marinus]|uniref:CLUMA_CG018548, isoform A n=1 Tax=Clunio marinus TaxID=568069 RepID=A0A1J1IYH4_9DIPT|nr:CLUMA_CG018548, isoform A [Clunio marinus]
MLSMVKVLELVVVQSVTSPMFECSPKDFVKKTFQCRHHCLEMNLNKSKKLFAPCEKSLALLAKTFKEIATCHGSKITSRMASFKSRLEFSGPLQEVKSKRGRKKASSLR